MSRYKVATAILALMIFAGCDEIVVDGQMADTDAMSSQRGPRMAEAPAAEGTVKCDEIEEVYENTSGADRCKQVSVTNNCEGESEILEWFIEDGTKIVDGDVPFRRIPGDKSKVYDITVTDGKGLDIDCGHGDVGDCCSYTIEPCASAVFEDVAHIF